jgi:eukaryotic-like serine/threonine-protein kinase
MSLDKGARVAATPQHWQRAFGPYNPRQLPLASGVRLGHYEILSAIGAGGMGEVYKARDTRLERDVAIKILPHAFAGDAPRVARFQREAKLLAALNHPNITQIFGLEQAGDVHVLAMELVTGEDLSERIARGAIPLDEALPIAGEIAEALEAAHERGITHRDLKPGNIRLRPDGTVKLVDFGLAKLLEPDGVSSPPSESPTIATPAVTGTGTILGTAPYMSPEQARGNPLDHRTDIWAFGCVLYEMLAGRRAFPGDRVSEVLASLLAREPDQAALPAATPPAIRRLLRHCLHKDARERLRDIGDARLAIRDALAGADPEATVVTAPGPDRPRRAQRAWIGVLLVSALALFASSMIALRPAPVAPEMRVDIATPPSAVPLSLALSPDGRTIAYVVTSESRSDLWLRSLESGSARAVAGTGGAECPFWSPDSHSVAFFAEDKLRRVDADGGSVQTLAHAPAGCGGTWNRDGVILFASLGNPIARVPAAGGDPVALPRMAQQGSDFSPQFLPDGRSFLYYVRGAPEVRGVYVGRLDETVEARRLLESDTGAVFAPPGKLLFVRQETLLAQDFDPVRWELSGDPLAVAEHVAVGATGLSVSRAGNIAFRASSAGARRQFIWFDRAGRERARVGDPVGTSLASPSLSSDGQRVALYRNSDGNTDVWVLETKRGALSRLTSDLADDVAPVWSPDGGRVVFSSNRRGVHDLYQRPLAGGGSEELLLATAQPKLATDWSSDGRFLLFNRRDPKTGLDIWALPVDGTGKPFRVVQTTFDEQNAQFSPDGHWIAYQSTESGRADVYVQPFPGPGTRSLVSTSGGSHVRWRRDGRELFFLAPNGRLMAVPVRLPPGARALEIGQPEILFTPALGGAVQQGDFRQQYMVSPDGKRFLVPTVMGESAAPITLILNWKPRP